MNTCSVIRSSRPVGHSPLRFSLDGMPPMSAVLVRSPGGLRSRTPGDGIHEIIRVKARLSSSSSHSGVDQTGLEHVECASAVLASSSREGVGNGRVETTVC